MRGASLRWLALLWSHPMKPDLTDWLRAVTNPRLLEVCPELAQIPPTLLAAAWEKMPQGTMPKTHIFALGIVLGLTAAASAPSSR